MKLLESLIISDLFTESDIDFLSKKIVSVGEPRANISDGSDQRYYDQTINTRWDYYDPDNRDLRDLLDEKFRSALGRDLKIGSSHLLDSKIPYHIHADVKHNDRDQIPEYTIVIPLGTYDSSTIVFDQWIEDSNDFEDYKITNTPFDRLQIDPRFCADNLSHIHPRDLFYLTLQSVFSWKAGDMFVMDRRRFHCSSNFIRKGISSKQGIIIWTHL